MSTASPTYGTPVSLTITLASLADNALRQSNELTTDCLTGILGVKIKTGASGPTTGSYVNIWAWGNSNGIRDGAAGASDAAITSNAGLRFVGRISTTATATTYTRTYDIGEVFGGSLPANWGVVIENQSDGAFDSTGSNHAITFVPMNVEVA